MVNIKNTIKNIITDNYFCKLRFEKSKIKARKEYFKNNGKENITILSPNCIAGEIYNILGLKFNSPTINASIKREDFIKFCLNLEQYLSVKPYISGYSKGHPILTLENKHLDRIDMRFVHDSDPQVVLNNWERRKQRIIKEEIYIIMDNKGPKEQELDDDIVSKINQFKSKKTLIFVSSPKSFKNTYQITKEQIKRYNYKKINGLYGFQSFFDYISFLTK